MIEATVPESLNSEFNDLKAYIENWYHAIGLVAKKWPKLLNLSDFKAQTPLMIAADNSDHVLVQIFIEAGADLNLQDFKGRTALNAAIAARSVECVHLLLDSGINTNFQTVDKNTVLHTAVRSGHPEIVALVYAVAPELIKAKNDNGHTPLDLMSFIQKDLNNFIDLMKSEKRLTGTASDFEKIRVLLGN